MLNVEGPRNPIEEEDGEEVDMNIGPQTLDEIIRVLRP